MFPLGRGRMTHYLNTKHVCFGFALAPPQIWEPMLKHLLASSADIIDEVWTWEVVHHGDAALINSEALPSVCMS